MSEFIQYLRSIWKTFRSNPTFVAFEGGAGGAILNCIDDAFKCGHLDFTSAGLHKLATVAIAGGITAIKLLYRPAPGSNPNQ